MDLTEPEQRCWDAYLATLPPDDPAHTAPVSSGMPGDERIADRLVGLYLDGRKTAGSGLVADYENAGDALPQVGDHWIVLDASGAPRCIVRTETVEFHAFRDVPERIAVAEGEGDLSLDHWRRGHARFFAPFLAEWGVDDLDGALVVTEFFTLVHRAGERSPDDAVALQAAPGPATP